MPTSIAFETRIYLACIALLILQRLFELRLSRRNEERLKARGAREYGAAHFPYMQLLHTLWFFALLFEIFYFQRPFRMELLWFALPVFGLGQFLRYAAQRTLGERWTVRIFILPDAPPVTGGLYRFIRHPNYVGVVLEILAAPLAHGAWMTALLFTVLNALLLRLRIRTEEAALKQKNDYQNYFQHIPTLLPKWKTRKT